MAQMISPLSPDGWLADLFGSKAARNGAVIRRKRRDIERFAGMDRFMSELERRGYRAVENGDQVIIFCNAAPVRPLTRAGLETARWYRFLWKKAGRKLSKFPWPGF